jgi:hypothetical protein
MAEEIVRNLSDGPDYAPDWRHQVVQGLLVDVLKDKDQRTRMTAILDCERDPFIRQYLRFRYDGVAANADGFRYAVGCQARNAETAGASMIKAMIIADRTAEEIAEELGTRTQNIVTFGKIFFDVRRYLNNESWLRRIVLSAPTVGIGEIEATRERRWLAAAYHRGWPGVEQIVFHRIPSTPEAAEAITQALHTTLASRALEFVQDLDSSGTPPSQADLDRFLAASNVQPRQPQVDPNRANVMSTFLRGIHGELEKLADDSPADESLAAVRQMKAQRLNGLGPTPKRQRRRFAGA